MDRRTTIALALCLLIFALFTVLQTRYAPKPKPQPPLAGAPGTAGTPGATTPLQPATGTTPAPTGTTATAAPTLAPATTSSLPEQLVVLETPLYRATFSNIGARLRSFELKRYAASWGESRFAEHPGKRPKRGHDDSCACGRLKRRISRRWARGFPVASIA